MNNTLIPVMPNHPKKNSKAVPMKKFYLFLFLLFASYMVSGQTQINLTFEAKDSQSQNPLTLESIYIQNITEDCDTSLSNETIYNSVSWVIPNATWPVGIGEVYAGGKGSIMINQTFPNPFQGETKVNIYKGKRGPLNLALVDGLGRTLVSYQNEFEKGYHSFRILSSIKGVLAVSVSDGQDKKSIKVINTLEGQPRNSILYLGQTPGFENRNLKSLENSGFSFYLGNEMTFTAFVTGYLDQTITDNPASDSTYTFYMTVSNLPEVETSSVTDITQSTAKCGGNVITDGGESVTARGVCWNTTGSPTTSESFTVDGDGTGYFTSSLSGLTPDTRYYVCAYATNNSGTVYGSDVTFKTSIPLLVTEADINDTLMYCYSKLSEYNEFLYLFDAVYSNTFPAPDVSWTDIYNHTPLSDNAKILMLWSKAFDIIYKTNLVIQSSEIVITDQQTHDQIIAQAKAIRAYLYSNLVNWFGPVPIEEGTTEGVIPRAMIDEVLSLIKQDALEASQSLPASWSIPDKFRIPRFFANALLSRAYQYTNSYTEALNPTQEIINSGMYALSAEINNFTSASTEIFLGFDKGNNTEFNNFFDKGSYVPVIRYTESFLVAAEASFFSGNTTAAINYINLLNIRRGLPTVTSLTSDELFQHWNTELVKEGNTFITLKRFGKALNLVQSPHRLVLPVPQFFIISNPYLTQNPGY
jgi:hypothetical protein